MVIKMNTEKLTIRQTSKDDISILYHLIQCMALYEKRPQDMTGTKEQLEYWIFERKAATALIAEYDGEVIGYALYYPIFGSFAAAGKIHLEDIFIKQDFRGFGFGKYFLAKVAEAALADGYTGMEWSCLDWNEPSLAFYKKVGANQETGREYFNFNKAEMEAAASYF